VLLSEPNVLVLDEPSNDVDTDMLAAMEDLLDSWPGTLIVVSHDRYLLERITDQQYAILDGRFRHLPGGVDEYLRLRASGAGSGAGTPTDTAGSPSTSPDDDATPPPALVGSALHAARKELEAADRRLGKLTGQVDALHVRMAEHNQSDYGWLGERTEELRALEAEVETLEERWLELSELVG
jgi:energy-coupling factor transporter ATP-binding protein EcfA2